jgi:FixJ family two-component response regulator
MGPARLGADHSRVKSGARRVTSQVSSREKEITQLVVQAYRNRKFAVKLSISEQTGKNHLYNSITFLERSAFSTGANWGSMQSIARLGRANPNETPAVVRAYCVYQIARLASNAIS